MPGVGLALGRLRAGATVAALRLARAPTGSPPRPPVDAGAYRFGERSCAGADRRAAIGRRGSALSERHLDGACVGARRFQPGAPLRGRGR